MTAELTVEFDRRYFKEISFVKEEVEERERFIEEEIPEIFQEVAKKDIDCIKQKASESGGYITEIVSYSYEKEGEDLLSISY